MRIENWEDLKPLLNKGVQDIHGQNWGEGPPEMVIELNDKSQINLTFCIHSSIYGICGDVEIEYYEALDD